jgi:hypothetical protein
VDRRRTALFALMAFAVATAAAIVISGARPANAQGIAPTVVQAVGYVCALLAALDLLAPAPHPAGADRRLGAAILVALAAMVGPDLFDGSRPDIGAGFLRLVCLVVIVAVAARLVATSRAPGRRRP